MYLHKPTKPTLHESNTLKVPQTFEEAALKPISSYWLCTHTAINPLSDSPELIPNEK